MNKFAYYYNNVIYKISNIDEYDEKCPKPAVITFDETDGCPGLKLNYTCDNTNKLGSDFISLCDFIEVGDFYKSNKFIKNNGSNSGITYYDYVFSLELNKVISKITLDMINGKISYDNEEEFNSIKNHYINLIDKKYLVKKTYYTCMNKITCIGECNADKGWKITVSSTENASIKDIDEQLKKDNIEKNIIQYALSISNPILSTINKSATGFEY